jgi:transcriptional regulator with XRE-family HTH domain
VSAADRTPATLALGAALRQARERTGMSLHAVQAASRGRWKAVVVGSYERGDRAVTAVRLLELAAFYGVPAASLLPGGGSGTESQAEAVVLERLAEELRARAVRLRGVDEEAT